jgi:hypothetical protein
VPALRGAALGVQAANFDRSSTVEYSNPVVIVVE